MFLGEELGLQRYDIIKYKKFRDLYDDQLNQFWRPNEISLIKDRNDYLDLTKEEKFVFDSNIRWQTITDSSLSRSIHKISEYITNSELEACCTIWAAFEQIHSDSYTHIFRNVLDNPKAFFDSILEDKEIVRRASEVVASYDQLFNNTGDIKEKIFDAVLMTQLTEGLAFYTSFACSFYFGKRGKMEGNAKIISLIARDERLHVSITQNIMKHWREDKSEGFYDIMKANEQKIYDAYGVAVESEKKWSEYLFSEGGLLGLNPELLKQYVEWLANNRLVSLGYKKIYDQKNNPLSGWLDSYSDSSKLQVAPQETEISSYKIASRNTEIDSGEFKDISL